MNKINGLRNLAWLILAFWGYSLGSLAQFDTTGGRFLLPVFDSVSLQSNIAYAQGINAMGQQQTLMMDIYEPAGDTLAERPVIILAHGGGFIQGAKEEMAYSCRQFALRGYVTVSIQYRLGLSSISAVGVSQMVIRATQDMKNAVRFLRKSALEGNPYRIHPDFVFAGGFSAGAITAVHVAYMDKLNELPTGLNIPSTDSLHNAGQYPGIDWKVKAVLNIAGAVGDTNWIEPGDVPVCSFHGTADNVVPYISGNFAGLLPLFGSLSIHQRCQNLGIRSNLRAFAGAGHDYTSANASFRDTTEIRIARFLLPFLTESPTRRHAYWPGAKPNARIYKSGSSLKVYLDEAVQQWLFVDLLGRTLAQGSNNISQQPIILPNKMGWLQVFSESKGRFSLKIRGDFISE